MFQDQGPGNPGRNFQDKEKRKKRNQRRKKSISNVKRDAGVKSENTEEDTEKAKMGVVETTSSQTEESVPIEVDPQAEDDLQTVENCGERRRKDATMVQAQTQTRKLRGTDKFTQTPAVFQSNQETQTDFPVPKQDDANDEKTQPGTKSAADTPLKQDKHTPQPKLQDDKTVQTPSRQNENPDSDGASSGSAKEQNLKKEPKSNEENPSVGTSGDPTDSQAEKGAITKSYAKAVSGEGRSKNQSSMEASKAADKTTKPSQSTR